MSQAPSSRLSPRWSKARSELFYLALDRTVMAVPYTVEGESFSPGTPTPWAGVRAAWRHQGGGYDVHPGGERIALGLREGDASHTLVVVTGFFEELRRRTGDATRE